MIEESGVRVFYEASTRRFLVLLSLLLALNILAALTSLSVGSAGFCWPWSTKCTAFMGLRATRLLCAMSTGILLAYSGHLLQNITRNPLAEPYILGLSSGALAALGIALLVSGGWILYSTVSLSLIAFLGSLAAYVIVILIAEASGGGTAALILGGIAVNILFSGVAEFTLFLVQALYNQPMLVLLAGSFAYTKWSDAITLSIIAGLAVAVSLLLFKPLNALLFGDEYAEQLGYNPRNVRRVAATLASLLAGVTVAVAGIIGFIGLLSPHIARMALRTSDTRFTLPLSLLIGSFILLSADILARIIALVLLVGELPVGIYSSLIGSPFLVYLIATRLKG